MKRSLASVVALALILVTPPPPAWARFAEAARAAVRTPGAATVGVVGVLSPSAVFPSAVVPSAPAFAAIPPAPAAIPSAPAAETAEPGAAVRAELAETAGALSAPDAQPEEALDRLFIGGHWRASLGDGVQSSVPSADMPAASGLEQSSDGLRGGGSKVPAPSAPNAPRRSRLLGAVKALGTVGLAAAATVGLNAAGLMLAPAVFGVVPLAAVWAVSSGVLLFPAALYARWRLAKRDSPRLGKVKALMDVSIGAYAGALFVAAPGLALALSSAGLMTAVIPAAGLAAGLASRGMPFVNSVLVWGALSLAPLAVGAAAVGGLAAAPILGMLALPAMTTMAFFLGSLITAAETGRPFSVPGSLQKLRFPSFQWVMIGVTFALLSGYGAVYSNLAFLAWNLLGGRQPGPWDKNLPLWKNLLNKAASFDVLYLGLLVFTAATGFASPLTFLVIAFSGERASSWTERLLTRLLPRAKPAPSTQSATIHDDSYAGDAPARWPQYRYWAKTFGLIGAMAGIGVLMGFSVFGFHSLLTSMIPAVILAVIPFWFATSIIKAVMRTAPADEAGDPEFFSIMKGLRDKINARRAAQGKREIPMPEMVNDPLPLPNAYATGRDPFHALVGVTAGIKEMTLDPENVREGVARLISAADPSTKAFKVFRLAISGSISGVTTESSPADIQAAVLKADRVELKALGVRALSGVLGHEFSHVMDRHMLSGTIAGAVSASIAFASYGVMWAVGHAQVAVKKAFDKVLGRRAPEPGAARVVEPISVGVAAKSLAALLKLFAALWVPVLVQIVQMASSRNNEGMADEDGALLSEDPESLALALGLLTTWRPKSGVRLPDASLPRLVALSHLMTVNPLEQARRADALPGLDAVTSAVAGKEDDFLFNLFITHPDTRVRIEKLHDMAEALRASRPRRPTPPPGDGGGGGKPLAFAPATAPGRSGGGLFRGAWGRLKGLFRVLPDEGRNRAFWRFIAGQAMATLGAYFHYTALPGLAAPTPADADKLGYNRAAGWASQAVSSVATGSTVDRVPLRTTLVWTQLGRALLMALVPVLFATGHLGFAAFALLIGAAGFLQATSQTAGSVAFNRILADDETYYNRANAVSTIVVGAVGVAAPLLAGAFIAWAGAFFAAPLMGQALAYGVYGVLLLGTAVVYGLFLNLPAPHAAGPAPRRSPVRELVEGFRLALSNRFLRVYLLLSTLSWGAGDSLVFLALPRYLSDVLKIGPGAFGLFLAASSLGVSLSSGLVALARDPAQTALAPAARGFRASLAERLPGLGASRLDGAAAALRDSVSPVLERYKADWREGGGERGAAELSSDVLAEAASRLSAVLEISSDRAVEALEDAGAARDVRVWAVRRGEELLSRARRDAASGMDFLQRQGLWTNWLHAASWLAYAGVFFTCALWPSAALMLISALLAGPASIVWASLTTRVVAGTFRGDQGKVYGAVAFYVMICSIAGVLGFGWMLAALPTATALSIVGGILVVCAALDLLQGRLIFPILRR